MMEQKLKQKVLDYIIANNGKYNGSEITWNLNIWNVELFRELEQENKIRYDYDKQKWYAV